MKKIAFLLTISLFLQGFFVSPVLARVIATYPSSYTEGEDTLELPYEEPQPDLPLYRVYNVDNKIIVSTRVPIAGMQIETSGDWDLSQSLLPNGWTLRENNGRVLMYSLSDSVLNGPVDLFSYSGNLSVSQTVAADRQGNRIMPPPNSSVPQVVALSEDKLIEYNNFFDSVSKQDISLLATTSTIVYADNISAGPGQTNVEYNISMDNFDSSVAGIQFTLSDLPDWVLAVNAVSQVVGFDAYVNDHDGIAELMVINLEGDTMPVGNNLPLVDLYFNVDNSAVLGGVSTTTFSEIIVSDVYGNPLVGEGVAGVVAIGTKGDINIDGVVDILDVVKTINFALDIETPTQNELWLADMNNDLQINVLDVVQIINLIFIPVPDQLAVNLAVDTPAAGFVVSNAVRHPFTKINLVAGDQDVEVDLLTLQRGGLGQDGAFSSVDIVDADTLLPVTASQQVLNASHQATFNQNFVIPANTTKSLYLVGNMGTLVNYAGEAPSLDLVGITLVGSTPIVASLPIAGNQQTLNATITIGSVGAGIGTYNQATSTAVSLGSQDYTFLGFRIQSGSVEPIVFDQIAIYQEGTAQLGTDLVNFELFRDTTKIADGIVNGDYIYFTNLNDYIPQGNTFQYQVKADVAGGIARTVDLGIYDRYDALVTGQTYGYNIAIYTFGPGSSWNSPILSGNQFTLSGGTLSVANGNSVPAQNITIGNDQEIGAFQFTATGENMEISSLSLNIVSSASATIEDALQGVKIVDENGTTVAGPVDLMNNTLRATFSDLFVVPVGVHEYKVVANLVPNGGWNSNDTIYAQLNTPATSIVATGALSGNRIWAMPNSAVNTNIQTVKTANLTVTRDTLPANGYAIIGAQDVLLGSWTFDAGESGEDIRVTTLQFAASSSNATNLTVYDGAYASGVALTPVMPAPAINYDGATTTFAFDNPIIIPAGTSRTVQLVGDIESSATPGNSAQFGLTDISYSLNNSVIAYGVNTGIRAGVYLVADNGAVLTYVPTGSVTVSNYNNPTNSLVRAGATGVTFGSIKFDAMFEDLDLDQLRIYIQDGGITGTATGNYQDVVMVYIYDGSTLLASNAIPSTGYYTFNFNNGSLVVPREGSKILTIKADIGTINSNFDNAPASPSADIKFGLGGTDGFRFTGSDSNAVATETYLGSTTSAKVLHKAIPTVSYSTTANPLGAVTALNNGASDLFAFSVNADSGGSDVLLYRTSFYLATGGGWNIGVNNCYLKDNYGNAISYPTSPIFMSNGGTYLSFVFNNPNISAGDMKEAIPISPGSTEVYKLNCTVSYAGAGAYVSIALLGDVASSTPATSFGTPESTGQNVADAWRVMDQGNFVWSDNFKNRGLAVDGANATAYGQWYNGYLVAGLGTQTTTTPYSIGWTAKVLPDENVKVETVYKMQEVVR